MTRTTRGFNQIKSDSITGHNIVSGVGIYSETANYSSGDVVFWAAGNYKANAPITGGVVNDFTNAPDVSANWDLQSSGASSSGVSGSVQFSDGLSGFLSDDTNFHYDDTNNKLDINGIDIPNTTSSNTGVVFKNGSRFLHNFNYGDNGTVTTAGDNIFMGRNAGNFTMGSTATAASDSSYNIGIGASALQSNTTGNSNTSVGVGALQNNIDGFNNTAIGGYALQQNASGLLNTAIGVNSLRYITSGLYNTSIGYDAGSQHSTGNNTTGQFGVFVGSDTKPLSNGNSNEIVIGYGATGNGSNTATLGNTSITKTMLNGDVGVGTVSQVSKLSVKGSTGESIETISTTTTLDNTHSTVLVDASAGVVTVNLPTAASVFSDGVGRIYKVKLIDATNNAIITPNGVETIDGATTKTISVQYETISFQSDGINWFII